MTSALITEAALIAAKTSHGPSIPINTPLSTGPTKIASPSRVLEAALEAVSSPGVSASSGRIALWTGLVRVIEQLVAIAPMKTTHGGAFDHNAIAVAPMTADWVA